MTAQGIALGLEKRNAGALKGRNNWGCVALSGLGGFLGELISWGDAPGFHIVPFQGGTHAVHLQLP